MDRIIRSNIALIPDDIELIVGIPRSGMLPATLLSVYLNLPLTDSISLLSDNSHGTATRNYRINSEKNSTDIRDYNRILVIDDSCYSGRSIYEVKQQMETMPDCNTEIVYACVYVTPQAVSCVDLYFEIVPQPRLFEWNIMNHDIIYRSCFDIDGVLCVDPTEEQNDDGEKYIEFLQTAKPLWIPKFEIGVLVTSRLEKYRSYTEKWLNDHGVKYQNLVMLDLASKEERIRMGAHAVFKANVYSRITETVLFYESDPGQAKYIAEATGKAVYCVGDNSFYDEIQGVDKYYETKKELENYALQITGISEKLEILRLRINDNSGNDDIPGIVIESWDAVLSDMKSTLFKDKVFEIEEELVKAKKVAEEGNTSLLKDVLGNIAPMVKEALASEIARWDNKL